MDSYNTLNRVKLVYCLVAGGGLGVIAYLEFQSTYFMLTIFTALLSCILLANAGMLVFGHSVKTAGYFDRLLATLVGLYSVFAAEYGHQHDIYWIYFFPITAFFLFKLRSAIYLTLLYTPIAIFIIGKTAPPLHEAQILFSYAVISTVSLFLAMVKSRTNTLLEPLISRDISTGAQLSKFLRPALSIEITRAEREGTGLLLMHIKTPGINKRTSKDDVDDIVSKYAKSISKHLRVFDQYYRSGKQNFTVILPHATSSEAIETAKRIISEVPLENANKTEVGFASLNVGDTADSLIKLCKQDLIHVTN